MLIFSLLLYFVPEPTVQQQCHTNNGSVVGIGGTECVLLSPYNHYQWSTCLTEDYIMRASNQSHDCRGRATVYAGTNACKSYTNLIKVRCTMIVVACLVEQPRKHRLTSYPHTATALVAKTAIGIGSVWSDATNVKERMTVTLLSTPCKDIRRDAFNSHPECYVNPASGAPGICELWCPDVWRAFWLVNFEGGALSSAPIETGKQMLSVMARCFSRWPLSGCIPAAQTSLLITVLPGSIGTRLSVLAAAKLVNYIATEQNWIENGFRWFPFLDDDDDNSGMGNRNK